MRLLVFGISSGYGGTEAVVYSVLKDLHDNGISFDFVNTFTKPLSSEKWLQSLNCRILPLNLKKRGRYLKYRAEVKKFFLKHRGEFDGLWINIQEPDFVDVIKIAKNSGIEKINVVAHNAGSPNKSDFLRNLSLRMSKRALKKLTITRIAVSQLAGKVTYGVNSNFKVIRSGIDVKKFAYSSIKRSLIRSQLCISEGERLFLFAGRLEEQKNPLFALAVFKRILNNDAMSHCLFVGDGTCDKAIADEIKSSGLNSRIHQVHETTDISPFLSAADALLFPSIYEGMGMVLIEAQCSGLPCFASDGPIPKEAQVTSLVTWLPLNKGPAFWAETILAAPINKNREGYDKKLQELGLDYQTVAQKYFSLFTE